MIWLVGAGKMAVQYAHALDRMEQGFDTIGRGEISAQRFTALSGGCPVATGGLERYLGTYPEMPEAAIACVGVEQLKSIAMMLLEYGVKTIMLEKPGGIDRDEIKTIRMAAEEHQARVYVAYNRRFFASVKRAREVIESEGGVSSFNFEFTELVDKLEKMIKAPGVMERCFLTNSTHVVDLAFFLGGMPVEISTYCRGGLKWHPSASIFAGGGVTTTGALFSYSANWEAPGRWGLEVLTNASRLIFQPLEQLSVQKRGSFEKTVVDVDDSLDTSFKPGIYRMVNSLIQGDSADLCTIDEQCQRIDIYYRMANYDGRG